MPPKNQIPCAEPTTAVSSPLGDQYAVSKIVVWGIGIDYQPTPRVALKNNSLVFISVRPQRECYAAS